MIFKIYKLGSRYRLIAFKSDYGSAKKKEKDFFTSHEKNLALARKFDSHDMFLELEENSRIRDEIDLELNQGRFINNISRAKSRVRELALCNSWEWFFTLTVSPDKNIRYNLSEVQRKVSDSFANFNKKYNSKAKYLLIPEQHKDGAWHIHGLLLGISGEAIAKSPASDKYLHIPYLSTSIGFNSVDKIKSLERCASYITKYITKDMTGNNIGKNKRLFWASRGLQRKELFFAGKTHNEQMFDYENDYVKIKEFKECELSKVLDNLK